VTAADAALLLAGICAGILIWELAGWLIEHNRCIAIREPRTEDPRWGRCELRRGHDGLHALPRRAQQLRWSTDEIWLSPHPPGRHAATLTDELFDPDNDGDR
jgi:hypothetical protein